MLTKDLHKKYVAFINLNMKEFDIHSFLSELDEEYSKFEQQIFTQFLSEEGIDFGLTQFIKDAFSFYGKYGYSIEYIDFLNPKLLNELDTEYINWYRLSYLSSKDNSIFKYPPPYELAMLHDDVGFQSKYPDHPLAMDNRFTRQDTLISFNRYFLKEVSGNEEDLYELSNEGKIFIDNFGLPNILNKLHFILFDCSASIRDRCLDAINAVGDKSSYYALKKLVEQEKESEHITQKAKSILNKLQK